jgi:mannose-1-phosphate guanylyltransferase
VALDEDGRVERFVEKPAPGTEPSNQINAGTYVLEPSVLDLIPAGRRVSIERDTFPQVVAGGRLFAMATDDYWLDAGNPVLYLRANLDLLDDGRRPVGSVGAHAAAKVDTTAVVTNSIIGADATVANDATITDSVLLPGAVIDARAVVTNSVVMGRIGEGATVNGCVIGLHGVVAPGEHLSDEYRPPVAST